MSHSYSKLLSFFLKYFFSAYTVLGPILGARHTAENETEMNSHPCGDYTLEGRDMLYPVEL